MQTNEPRIFVKVLLSNTFTKILGSDLSANRGMINHGGHLQVWRSSLTISQQA